MLKSSNNTSGAVVALVVTTLVFAFGCRSTQEGARDETYAKLNSAQVVANAVPYEARPLPLTDIRLTGAVETRGGFGCGVTIPQFWW